MVVLILVYFGFKYDMECSMYVLDFIPFKFFSTVSKKIPSMVKCIIDNELTALCVTFYKDFEDFIERINRKGYTTKGSK